MQLRHTNKVSLRGQPRQYEVPFTMTRPAGGSDNDGDNSSNESSNKKIASSGRIRQSVLPEGAAKKRRLSSRIPKQRQDTGAGSDDRTNQLDRASVAAESPLEPNRMGNEHPNDMASAGLIAQFRQALDVDGSLYIDMKKARNALEATAGNMQLAAQLYWDDYLVSEATASLPQEQPVEDQKTAYLVGKRSGSSDGSNEQNGHSNQAPRQPSPKMDRSTDRESSEASGEPQQEIGDQQMDVGGPAEESRQQHHRQQPRQAQELRLDVQPGESVSVSDDEVGGSGKPRLTGTIHPPSRCVPTETSRHRRIHHQKMIMAAAAAVARKVLPVPSLPKDSERMRKRLVPFEKEDDFDYISDSEWLEGDDGSPSAPLEILWGIGKKQNVTSGHKSPANHGQGASNEHNVVADEDLEDLSGVDSVGGIPHTWLNASFTLSPCGNGLQVTPPPLEDVEIFTWSQQNHNQSSNVSGVPPPYHCKAITAVLSLVTALLYTGASIQGAQVIGVSGKRPFADLSLEERKREFEGRLTDALASLLHIAAMASKERKLRALQKASSASRLLHSSAFQQKILHMKRRLKLIPTCFWEEGTDSLPTRAPDGPAYCRARVATSLTHVDDIHLYVSSTIRSFTARGGVALLLETILRIHGKRVISRLLNRAHRESPRSSVTHKHMIRCSCEERQIRLCQENPLPAVVRNDPSKLLDTTPPGHQCISVELLSLLCTGTVHPNWTDWSTQGLGFGFLGCRVASMGWQLARPKQPVWVLQGDTCYSVLRLKKTMELEPAAVARLDHPGAIFSMEHWNTWYHEAQKTEFRIISAPQEWTPPNPMAASAPNTSFYNFSKSTNPLRLEDGRMRLSDIASANQHKKNIAMESEYHITEEEINRTSYHPDDERFYPGDFTMWRFDMGEDCSPGNMNHDVSSEEFNRNWTPFYRLTKRQQQVVEMKLGPKIKTILWSRWPHATVDNFTPSGASPVV